MSTHNLLFSVAGPHSQHTLDPYTSVLHGNKQVSQSESSQAYIEVLAIDPDAPLRTHQRARWFDLDAPGMWDLLDINGPTLMGWVAGVQPGCVQGTSSEPQLQLSASHAVCDHHGLDVGEILHLERRNDHGDLLAWDITVRGDGQRVLNGVFPSLISWRSAHPSTTLPRNLSQPITQLQQPQPRTDTESQTCNTAIRLSQLTLYTAEADVTRVTSALGALARMAPMTMTTSRQPITTQQTQGLPHAAIVVRESKSPRLAATLHTPKGVVTLESIDLNYRSREKT